MLRRTREQQQGQVLALFALGFIAFIAAVALIVDGGYAYAQHRVSQNASDAAAEAGALVLAEGLVGHPVTDQEVKQAVDGVLTAMDMDVVGSWSEYTNIDGDRLGVIVGAMGSQKPPSAAAGVAVTGDLPFETFFARALGIDWFNAVTGATAVAGYATDTGGPFLPVTPPVDVVVDCYNDGSPEWQEPMGLWLGSGETLVESHLYVIPLCASGPGNVGWIDFDPPDGGTSTLISNIWPPMANPPVIPLPSWQWMTEAGDTAASGLEDALRHWDLHTVLIPLFDDTCDEMPAGPEEPCLGDPGHGTNNVYHFPTIAALELCGTNPDGSIPAWCVDDDGNQYGHGSYIAGGSTKDCNLNKNGTACLVGRFRSFIRGGTVTGTLTGDPSASTVVGVQLIK